MNTNNIPAQLQELENQLAYNAKSTQIVTSGYIVLHNAVRLLLSKGKDGCGLLIIYTAILSHANNTTHTSYPSLQCLEEETGYTRKVIIGYINRLIEMGLLLKISGSAKSHKASQYFFPYEWEGEKERYQTALKELSSSNNTNNKETNITEDELEELDF